MHEHSEHLRATAGAHAAVPSGSRQSGQRCRHMGTAAFVGAAKTQAPLSRANAFPRAIVCIRLQVDRRCVMTAVAIDAGEAALDRFVVGIRLGIGIEGRQPAQVVTSGCQQDEATSPADQRSVGSFILKRRLRGDQPQPPVQSRNKGCNACIKRLEKRTGASSAQTQMQAMPRAATGRCSISLSRSATSPWLK